MQLDLTQLDPMQLFPASGTGCPCKTSIKHGLVFPSWFQENEILQCTDLVGMTTTLSCSLQSAKRDGQSVSPGGWTHLPPLRKYLNSNSIWQNFVCCDRPFLGERCSPWQVEIFLSEKTAIGKWRGWDRKVRWPLRGIQETGHGAKSLPVFSSPSRCLSAWISHLAFPLLVLCYANRAQLRHAHRAIFRGKGLQLHPAKQVVEGLLEASLLHKRIGEAKLTPAPDMLQLWPLATPELLLCSHGIESNVVPDAKANHTVKNMGKKKWQGRTSAVICFSRVPEEGAAGHTLAAALGVLQPDHLACSLQISTFKVFS